MKLQERYEGLIKWFSENMPTAETELHYESPFQLLVAVILSAQCTDKRVNMVTPALFHDYPTPEVMAEASPEALFEYIKSVTFPNNKAKALAKAARMIVNDFNGKVPSDFDNLIKIPGVGRKTANVMLAVVFDKAAMPVDTHVFRVSNRIGLTDNSKTPLETEKLLSRIFPSICFPKPTIGSSCMDAMCAPHAIPDAGNAAFPEFAAISKRNKKHNAKLNPATILT